VRVNVVGHQGVGKTTLVKRLQGFSPTCPDRNIQPTEALDIEENTCRCTEQPGNRIWETNINGIQNVTFLLFTPFASFKCFILMKTGSNIDVFF